MLLLHYHYYHRDQCHYYYYYYYIIITIIIILLLKLSLLLLLLLLLLLSLLRLLLLGDNKICRERLSIFLQKKEAQDIVQIMNQYQEKKLQKPKVFRPTKWAELKYKPVTIQEGEDGEIDQNPTVEEDMAFPDPMALSELDLRATQVLYSSGALKDKQKTIFDTGNDDDDDDDDDLYITTVATNPDGAKIFPSILPFEKYFSPLLYLSIIHGNIVIITIIITIITIISTSIAIIVIIITMIVIIR